MRRIDATRNGKPAAVVLSPEDLDELADARRVRERIAAGLASAAQGRAIPSAEARRRVRAKITAAGR